jgi:hypothetical protein
VSSTDSPGYACYVILCEISQVLTAASMKITALWDIAPSSFVEVHRRFRGAYYLENEGDEVIALMLQYAPLKRQSASTRLHDATSQKAAIAII